MVISVSSGGSGSTTVSNVGSKTTSPYTLVINNPGDYTDWNVSSAEYYRNHTEKQNSTIGYLGIGVAAIGAFFLVNYALAKDNPAQKASNLQFEPVVYAKGNNVYTGIRMRYNF